MVAAFGNSPVFIVVGLALMVIAVLLLGLLMTALVRLSGWLSDRIGRR